MNKSIKDVFKLIDWKWMGVTYFVTILLFSAFSIIFSNWSILITGLCTLTLFVSIALIKSVYVLYKRYK